MKLNGHGYASQCAECDGEPMWSLLRRGDAVISWACAAHFTIVALELQRDHEITELVVKHYPKSKEWSEIRRSLDAVVNEGRPKHFCGGYYDVGQRYCPTCSLPIPQGDTGLSETKLPKEVR